MLIVKLAILDRSFALKRWLLLQHLLLVWVGQFAPKYHGQFAPKQWVSLRRNGVVSFIIISSYTFADVSQHIGNTFSAYPLVSKNRLNNVLVYEKEDNFKIGAEAYYFSPQTLNDGTQGRGYWTAGLMGEKIWERFSIFINFENLTDTRQTKFGPIYSGSITNPNFQDIYAPLDGFVVNAGIKIKL